MTHAVCETSLRNQKKRGFTLTEIAIVLGIIGLILGAIWVAASAVYNNLRVSKATTQILQVAQGVRAIYSTAPTTGDAAGTDETSVFRQAAIFPSDMINGTSVLDPWNNTVMVTSQTLTSVGDAFGIELNGVPASACIQILTSNTGAGRDVGLWYASASAAAKGASAYGTTQTTFPVTAANAATACAGTTNSVQFVFKLKG